MRQTTPGIGVWSYWLQCFQPTLTDKIPAIRRIVVIGHLHISLFKCEQFNYSHTHNTNAASFVQCAIFIYFLKFCSRHKNKSFNSIQRLHMDPESQDHNVKLKLCQNNARFENNIRNNGMSIKIYSEILLFVCVEK